VREHDAKVGDIRGIDTGPAGACGQYRRMARISGVDVVQQRFDTAIAFGNLVLVVLPALQRLAQRE